MICVYGAVSRLRTRLEIVSAYGACSIECTVLTATYYCVYLGIYITVKFLEVVLMLLFCASDIELRASPGHPFPRVQDE